MPTHASAPPSGDAERRRIVRLITRLNIGGPARHALLLSRRLDDEFPTVLVAGDPATTEGELTDPQVPVQRVPLVRPVRPATDARALWAVRRLLRAHRPAVLATHMAKAGTVGRLAAMTVRPAPRLVHTFHGHVLDGYFRPHVERAFFEVERRLALRTDALVAVSTEVRDSLLDLGVGRPEQYRVVPLGLDLDPFLAINGPTGGLRARIGVSAETPLVGMIGRLVPIKDGVTMLDAIARLPQVHLAVVGDGEDRERLVRHALSLGLGERAHFVSWWRDVPGAVADVDVVALSSRNEGTPASLIEALAGARSVVATRVGGVSSVVDDGVTGFLVPAGDSDALARRIGQLLDDPDLRRRFGAAGRERSRSRFGVERLVAELRELYREVLAR